MVSAWWLVGVSVCGLLAVFLLWGRMISDRCLLDRKTVKLEDEIRGYKRREARAFDVITVVSGQLEDAFEELQDCLDLSPSGSLPTIGDVCNALRQARRQLISDNETIKSLQRDLLAAEGSYELQKSALLRDAIIVLGNSRDQVGVSIDSLQSTLRGLETLQSELGCLINSVGERHRSIVVDCSNANCGRDPVVSPSSVA